MNIKKTFSLTTIGYGAIICSLILAAYAYWVTSNIVTVTVGEYSLLLSPQSQQVEINSNASFTATLSNGGSPVSGATIYLYKSDVLQYSNTTLADGSCQFTVKMTDSFGIYDFYANYEVP